MSNHRAILLIPLLLIFAACTGTATPSPVDTPSATAPESTDLAATLDVTPESTPEATPELPPDPELLAWIDVPLDRTAARGGSRLTLISRTGSTREVAQFPPETTRVIPCGASGRYFALYAGGDTGALYLMNGTTLGAPVLLSYRLGCFDDRTAQFAPDGTRFGVIDYNPTAFTKEYADGVLRVYDTETRGEVASFEDIIAYTLTADGAALVRFYQNARGEAAEAALNWWDGVENREVLTLTPTGSDCRFTSAAITVRGSLGIVSLGHRCTGEGTDWQVYAVDFETRIATLAASGDSGGAYVAYARTNNVWLSPDGAHILLTVPDGVSVRTAALLAINLNDLSVTQVIDRQMLLPHHEDVQNRLWLSPDGAWLAAFITSPTPGVGGLKLAVVNLDEPGEPLTVDLGMDTADGVIFDGSTLYYVQSTSSLTATGSVNALDLTLGTPRRVVRGLFSGRLVVTADQQTGALALTDGISDEQPHRDVVGLNMRTGTLVTFYDGGIGTPYAGEPLGWLIPNETDITQSGG